MKLLSRRIICVVVVLCMQGDGLGELIKQEEINYQNYAFKQWFGTTLVWRYDRLPQNATLEKRRLPYSGAIYPDHRGGTAAVLEKYDRAFHSGRRRASAFEWQDISLRGMPDWAGHCNGWVAAAIRHAEPQQNVLRNGVVFTPADIKALLAELYVYSDSEFLGGIDPAINPGTLHVIITNWLGLGQHPIGMETSLGEEVWNYPVFGYAANSRKRDSRQVEVKINVGYVDFVNEEIDEAPRRYGRRYFHYTLDLSEDGEIIGGSYLPDSDRIDMLWVPLKPTSGNTPGNEEGNPYLDPEIVLAMWREATPAEVRAEWYVVDPIQEDAVVETEWFTITPTPDAMRLADTPEDERQMAIGVRSISASVVPPNVNQTAMQDALANTEPPEPFQLLQASEADTDLSEPSTSPDQTQPSSAGPVAGLDDASPADIAQEEPETVHEEHVGPVVSPVEGTLEEPAAEPAEELVEDSMEIVREMFSNGAAKIEREVSLDDQFNYINNGWYREWNEDGTLIVEGYFENGRRTGAWKRLHWVQEGEHFQRPPFRFFDEPFLSEASFQNGELHGKWTITDSKKRLVSELEFEHGRRQGPHVDWFPDGNKMREVSYREGVIDVFGRVYDKDGQLVTEEEYVAGRRRSVEVEMYVSTKKRAEKHMLLPPTVIDIPDDWWTGKLATFRTEEGKPVQHGPTTAWYENGQVRFQGAFREGEPVGEFQWWRENGQICQQGAYVAGKQHGDWQWWHPNGSKAAVGCYDRGAPINRWLWWNPDGRLANTKVFQTSRVTFDPEVSALAPAIRN